MTLIEYFIRFSLSLTGIYLLWKITGSKKTDPVYDRFFMVFSPLVASIIAFIRLKIPIIGSGLVQLQDTPEIQTAMSFINGDKFSDISMESAGFDFFAIGKWIFLGVSVAFGLILVHSIFLKLKLIYKYGIIKKEKLKIVPVEQKILPFSFMRYIFLNPSEYDSVSLDAIVTHEKAHILQLHFLDIVFYELLKTVLWFHPVYWIMRKKLIESHEYLADTFALKSGIERLEYMNLILSHLNFQSLAGIGNNFSKTITLKRLQMMKTNNKSKLIPRIIFSISGAIAFTILLGFSYANAFFKTEIELSVTNKIFENLPDIAPVDLQKVKLTSGYGMRIHPLSKEKVMHKGVDLAAPLGTQVFATADGVVTEVKYAHKTAGLSIKIKHDETYLTFYSQLSKILVEENQKVKKGEVIGEVGSSGLSTGPHLHYEVRENGEAVNPEKFFEKK